MTRDFLSRRIFLAASAASALSIPTLARASFSDQISELEKSTGGRIGVYAVEVGSAQVIEHRADERFAMCSTFKALLAGLVLDEAAKGLFSAGDAIPINDVPLIGYSPVVEARLEQGVSYMSVLGLCRATVVLSDNTSANILLDLIGGPSGFTERMQAILGTDQLRLDRYEPELNENLVGEVRDTTTPRAMANALNNMLFGGAIADGAAAQMKALMIDCSTGMQRLRKTWPTNLVAGDKTGTSLNGLFGDNAFVLRLGKPPLIISAYVNAPNLGFGEGSAALAEVGMMIAKQFDLVVA